MRPAGARSSFFAGVLAPKFADPSGEFSEQAGRRRYPRTRQKSGLEHRLKISGFSISPMPGTWRGARRQRASARGAPKTWPWSRLLRFVSRVHVLALTDQAVVSAASFLTMVIIGRATDPSQLGAYAIAISVLASSYTIQGSLITLPYSIQRHRPLGTPAEHAGGSLAQSSILSAVAAILLMAIALAMFVRGAERELTAMTWALAAVM